MTSSTLYTTDSGISRDWVTISLTCFQFECNSKHLLPFLCTDLNFSLTILNHELIIRGALPVQQPTDRREHAQPGQAVGRQPREGARPHQQWTGGRGRQIASEVI